MPHMRRPPAAVRHISAHPLAFAVVALTVLFTTMCAAGAASFASSVTTIAVRRSLTADPGTAIYVSVSGPPAQSADVTARIGHQLTTAAPGLPLRISDARQSSFFSLPGRRRAETQIVTLSALPRHAKLLTGHWLAGMAGDGAGGAADSAGTAGAASSAAPIPACLPAPAARRLHLAVGDLLTLRGVADQTTITARVSCTFARREPGSGYWSLSPVSAAGFQKNGGPVLFGPLVTTAAMLAARQVPVQSAGLWARPDFGGPTHTDEHGQEAEVAQEYSVLDRAGRLQLPGEFVSTLGLRDRVRLALEPDHVGVWPDRPAGGRADETGPGHPDPEPGDGAEQGRSR